MSGNETPCSICGGTGSIKIEVIQDYCIYCHRCLLYNDTSREFPDCLHCSNGNAKLTSPKLIRCSHCGGSGNEPYY